MQNVKEIYIISHDSEVSCEYIVRRWTLQRGIDDVLKQIPDAIPLARCTSLEEARTAIPPGLQLRETCDAHDDSTIIETWY
jgi:hypothetical protein